tara:strand:+ start:105 stop:293 length:189 start_codon:yes stop_codon:yes gene_type:complete
MNNKFSLNLCNKYLLSYRDEFNKTYETGFYAKDAYECLILAKEFNEYIRAYPNSVIRIKQKF